VDGRRASGGSAQLAALIDEYGDTLLADLKYYYDIDLRDLFSEVALSPRYVLAFVKHLPLESAFVAARRGGSQFRGWDHDRYATAALVDAVNRNSYILLCANSDPKKRRPSPPEPFPLPESEKAKKQPKPGSFAFMAGQHFKAIKKKKAVASG
jgi:hypothetical protein